MSKNRPEVIPASDGTEKNRVAEFVSSSTSSKPEVTHEPVSESKIPAVDPNDPRSFFCEQSLDEGVASKILTEIDLRKPNASNDEFFRVNPDPQYTRGPLWTVKDDGEIYILAPHLRDIPEVKKTQVRLHTCINPDGDVFLWPITIPGTSGGSINKWHTTAINAAEVAKKRWVKLAISDRLRHYIVHEAEGAIDEPVWPALTLDEMLKIAFCGRTILDIDHVVLKKKRGIFLG